MSVEKEKELGIDREKSLKNPRRTPEKSWKKLRSNIGKFPENFPEKILEKSRENPTKIL